MTCETVPPCAGCSTEFTLDTSRRRLISLSLYTPTIRPLIRCMNGCPLARPWVASAAALTRPGRATRCERRSPGPSRPAPATGSYGQPAGPAAAGAAPHGCPSPPPPHPPAPAGTPSSARPPTPGPAASRPATSPQHHQSHKMITSQDDHLRQGHWAAWVSAFGLAMILESYMQQMHAGLASAVRSRASPTMMSVDPCILLTYCTVYSEYHEWRLDRKSTRLNSSHLV